MATHPAVRHVRRWLSRTAPPAGTDAELVRRFAATGDGAAFAQLVDRHGPMVLAVARRVVGEYQAAEDVFQATFLALARRAGRLRRPEALPGWLHRTAYHLGLNAVRNRARRQRAEAHFPASPQATLPDLDARELVAILDEELARLPERVRLPLVLCCLEGLTQDEVAGRLGWSAGAVRGRLERGRRLLRDRLARRGLTFSIGAGTALLLAPPASVAGPLRDATIRTATGEGASPSVAALAARVTASGSRAGVWSALVAAAGLLVVGTVALSGWRGADPPAPPGKVATPPAEAPGDRLPDGAVARLGWSPHRVGNSAFALSRDEKEIVTVSPEGIVRRFDAKTGRLLGRRQLTDRADVVPIGQMHAQLSADGTVAAMTESVAGGLRVAVWDVPAGKVLLRRGPETGARVGAYALSPDGKVLAVNEHGEKRTVFRAYDVATGRGKDLGELEYNVYHLHFSADSRRLVVSQISAGAGADARKFLSCFDVPAGKEVWKVPANCDHFAVSSDGRLVVFAQYDRPGYRLIETDLKTGKTTETEQPQAYGTAHVNVPVALAPDDRTLVAAHLEDLITWDLRAGQRIRKVAWPMIAGYGYGPVVGAFSADGKTVVTNRGALQRWDLTTGKPLFEPTEGEGLGGQVEHLAFTRDGKEVFASGWALNAARWDAGSGKRLAYHRERFGHQFVTTPEGLRSVWAEDFRAPHEVVVYDPVAGRALKTVQWAGKDEVGINGLRAYALAADGRTLLVLQGDEPGRGRNSYVIVHDTITDRRLTRFTLRGLFSFGQSPFSPCGRWLAFGGKVYHVRTGAELFDPSGGDGERLAAGSQWSPAPTWFSPDGRLLAGRLDAKGGRADALAVWELASGRVLARLPDAGLVAQVAFGPNGRTVALVDGRGAHVHDLLTAKRLAEFPAPDITCDANARGAAAQTVAFSPDGRQLATGHRDGSIVLWAVPRPPAAEAEDVWSALSDPSPVAGRAAVDRAVRDPAALKALAAKFRPPAEEPDPQVTGLIRDLDSDTYATREAASKKLRDLGTKAEPALRKALAAARSPEAIRRLEGILAGIAPAVETLPVSGETLRGIRAVEVLDRAGTAEARGLLREWAGQGRDARVAAEARAVLGRLGPATK